MEIIKIVKNIIEKAISAKVTGETFSLLKELGWDKSYGRLDLERRLGDPVATKIYEDYWRLRNAIRRRTFNPLHPVCSLREYDLLRRWDKIDYYQALDKIGVESLEQFIHFS